MKMICNLIVLLYLLFMAIYCISEDALVMSFVTFVILIIDVACALMQLSDWETYDTYDEHGIRVNKKFLDNFESLSKGEEETFRTVHRHNKSIVISDATSRELDKKCLPVTEKIEIITD